MPTTKSSLDTNLLRDYYAKMVIDQLTQPTWNEMFGHYHVTDKRSRWQKIKEAAYWRTIGRFKAWLHRDCGEW